MTSLVQTALDFCREVMGWGDCQPIEGSPKGTIVLMENSHVGYLGDYFHSADLNVVLAAVKGWCNANEASVEMGYYGYIPGEWQVSVSTAVSVEEIVHSDLCHALMAACVEAIRKLKA